MAKVKVGDTLLIVNVDEIAGGSQHWNNGDITEVVFVGEFIKAKSGIAGQTFNILRDEYEGIRKLAKFKPKKVKVGDKVYVENVAGIFLGAKYWSSGDVIEITALNAEGEDAERFWGATTAEDKKGFKFFFTANEKKAVRALRKVKGVKL